MYESPEICGCINVESLQTTTGSPGGDTFKRLKTICFIRLVNTLLVLFFVGTYFRGDNIIIFCVCLFSRICDENTGFSFRNSQNCLGIIENFSKNTKSMEVGTGEN